MNDCLDSGWISSAGDFELIKFNTKFKIMWEAIMPVLYEWNSWATNFFNFEWS